MRKISSFVCFFLAIVLDLFLLYGFWLPLWYLQTLRTWYHPIWNSQYDSESLGKLIFNIFKRFIIFKYMELMTVSRTRPTELPDASPAFHTFPAKVDDPWPGGSRWPLTWLSFFSFMFSFMILFILFSFLICLKYFPLHIKQQTINK